MAVGSLVGGLAFAARFFQFLRQGPGLHSTLSLCCFRASHAVDNYPRLRGGGGCGGLGGSNEISSNTLSWFELHTPRCAHLGCLWLMCNFTFTIFYYVVISV